MVLSIWDIWIPERNKIENDIAPTSLVLP